MRIKTALILFVSLISLSAASPEASAQTLQQQQEIVEKIAKAAAELKSLNCDFVQTKHLFLLSEKMVSRGEMNYKYPAKLHWKYTTPYQYLFVFNGTKVYVGNDQRKDVIDTNTNKAFKELARIMMSTVTGTVLSSSSDFTIEVVEDKTHWSVTLHPLKKGIKSMFSKIELSFTKSDLMIAEINIYEKNNDRTNIKLENISINSAIDESLFAIPE